MMTDIERMAGGWARPLLSPTWHYFALGSLCSECEFWVSTAQRHDALPPKARRVCRRCLAVTERLGCTEAASDAKLLARSAALAR
jgi:hypothetical protein